MFADISFHKKSGTSWRRHFIPKSKVLVGKEGSAQ